MKTKSSGAHFFSQGCDRGKSRVVGLQLVPTVVMFAQKEQDQEARWTQHIPRKMLVSLHDLRGQSAAFQN